MESEGTVVFRCLGPFEVEVNGDVVDSGGPKQRSLLAYLVLHAGEPVSLETSVNDGTLTAPPAPEKAFTHGGGI
jgi:hypothetical protein